MIISRTELKYYLPLRKYRDLRAAMEPFVAADPNVKPGARAYSVHSVYYDTPRMLYYLDKVEGEEVRRKFRLRYYNEWETDAPGLAAEPVWIELKCKQGPYIRKLRHGTDVARLNDFLSGPVSGDLSPELSALLFEYNLRPLQPVVRVSYRREPLRGLYEHNTRITFDSEIVGAYTNRFDVLQPLRRSMLMPAQYMLLEIKVVDSVPTWLSRLIERFELQQTVFSKYTTAIEKCGVLRRLTGESIHG